jgi:hypothetical protein
MNLSAVDTVQDLEEWVASNMPGARLTVDSAGDIVIHTGLRSAMGGYLHDAEQGECDTCDEPYDVTSRDNRCGDCGNCGDCCTHETGGEE